MSLEEIGIFDADGHVLEDVPAIVSHMPDVYAESSAVRFLSIFPGTTAGAITLARLPEGAGEAAGPAGWSEFLDDLHLQRAVVYPSFGLSHGWTVDFDMAIATARAYNDWLTATYLCIPRIEGMALLPMQEPDAAIDELRRAVRELGMVGAVLPATGLSLHLGAKQYWPVYAEAERLGCAISIHGGIHGGLGFDNVNVYALHNALGHAHAQAISLGAMVYNGIFDRFPRLRVAFLEGGVGWLLMALERLSGSFAALRPFDPRHELLELDPGESVADYVRGVIDDGRLFIGIEGDEPTLPAAIDMVGHAPFMFSSDFPHEVNKMTIRSELAELLENGKIGDEAKAAILRGNAERFYRCT